MKTKQIRALHGFARAADADIVARASAVYTAMSGNPNFPNPAVDLTAMKGALDTYNAVIADALDGSKKAIAEKDRQRAVVVNMLRLLGRYVEVHCNNDMAIFLSSGFQPASTLRGTPEPLPQGAVRKIEQGSLSGQLLVRFSAIPKARSYEVRYAVAGQDATAASWTIVLVTSAKTGLLVENLTPGTVYAFQVRALGKLGYTDWSDSVTRMVI